MTDTDKAAMRLAVLNMLLADLHNYPDNDAELEDVLEIAAEFSNFVIYGEIAV